MLFCTVFCLSREALCGRPRHAGTPVDASHERRAARPILAFKKQVSAPNSVEPSESCTMQIGLTTSRFQVQTSAG